MDSHEAEYRGAVDGMADTYGIPESHRTLHDGKHHVYWVCPTTGHLLHGPVIWCDGESLLVKLTLTKGALVSRSALKPVPRFFGGQG